MKKISKASKTTKSTKPYHLLVYVSDCTPKIKKFKTTKALGLFVDKFLKKHPDYLSVDSGYWVDYAISNIVGDVHFFADGMEVE